MQTGDEEPRLPEGVDSTSDVQSQRLAILEYAREQGFQIDRFIEVKASGRATKKHRRLDDLMGELTAATGS